MKKTIHVVGAVIRNDQDEVLCALRSPSMSMPNLWEFPGGKLEHNEHPEEALVREIQEELGCTISVGNQVADIYHEYPFIIVHLITFEAKITEGSPLANDHARIEWLPINTIEQLEWAPADLPTIDQLMGRAL
ncbi:(deoxy)nucleoside triphosphate pyrophosphohydrolase [Ammoniphilus sp. CFH 90114]|uniref:(deoxy)nucleoside triphosphate pyrophosphohydrolase n=1 Tax=Ammoniphilus sp. CFH 90114 TaxID=2493665 RepID=UPI00100D9D94|nr:(deoxy)nucleoside triphosphate pyrophosphohydrolase [Ammoniphilus sp. CFH 90114]RXT06347.1 (deoxy)nucleoside triphosphate pyrophosphohydrolase [Ammoniphilus sp. CFH 90114]